MYCFYAHLLTYGPNVQEERDVISQYSESRRTSFIVVAVLTVIGFLLRFYKINYPAAVVYVHRLDVLCDVN